MPSYSISMSPSTYSPSRLVQRLPDSPKNAITFVIARLFDTIRNTMDSMHRLREQQRSSQIRLEQIGELVQKLEDARNDKQSVYLRVNREGIHFSNRKGLRVRLGLSDKGYSSAASAIQGCVKGLELPGANQRIDIDAIRQALTDRHSEVQENLSTIEMRLTETSVRLNKANDDLEHMKIQRAAQEKLEEADAAIREAIADVWLTKAGASWINGKLREKAGTLRQNARVECSAQDVLSEMRQSAPPPSGAEHNIKQLFECTPNHFDRLLVQALGDSYAPGTTYRGTRLLPNELAKFDQAHQYGLQVQTSHFMSTTLLSDEAADYLKPEHHPGGEHLHQVMFTIIGEPCHLHSRERYDAVFEPGARFDVLANEQRGQLSYITLREATDKVGHPIII